MIRYVYGSGKMVDRVRKIPDPIMKVGKGNPTTSHVKSKSRERLFPRLILGQTDFNERLRVPFLRHDFCQVNNTLRITPLIVIPSNHFHHIAIHDHC